MKIFNKVPDISEIELVDIKAIIFDMDGTLLNSEVLHAKGLIDLLGDESEKTMNLLEQFVGLAEPAVYKILIDKKIIPNVSFDEFIRLKNESFRSFLEDESIMSKLIDKDLHELILKLKKTGFKIALVTASERTTTTLLIRSLNLESLFDVILTRDDTERSKPDPMPYNRSFELLGIKPYEAVIFEDSKTGLEAARSSGGNVYQVTWYQ